jgi:hypothetical protein
MNILEFTFKWQVFGRLLHYSINEETGEYHMKVDEPEEVVPLTIEERKTRSDSVFFINICIGIALALIFGVHVGPPRRDSLSGIVGSKVADLFRFIFPTATLENSLLILALIALLTIYITIRTDALSWRLHLNVASFNILYFGYSSHAVCGYEYGRRRRQSTTIVKPVTTPEMVVKPKEEEEDNVQLFGKDTSHEYQRRRRRGL